MRIPSRETLQMFILLALVSIVHSQSCSATVKYTNCTTSASYGISACNGKVSSVPDAAYYDCLCQGSKVLMACYDICPDDAQLQLQRSLTEQNTGASCKAAQEMSSIGMTMTLSSSIVSTVGSMTETMASTALSATMSMTSASGSTGSAASMTKKAGTAGSTATASMNVVKPSSTQAVALPPPWVNSNADKSYIPILFSALVICAMMML